MQRKLKLKTQRKIEYKDKIFYYSLLALPLLQFCVFYIAVNFNSILLSFKTLDSSDPFSKTLVYAEDLLVNYKQVFASFSSRYAPMLGASALVWLFTCIVPIVLAILFSFFIFKKGLMSKAFRIILFLPSILPITLLVGVYTQFMNFAIPSYLNLDSSTVLISANIPNKNLVFWLVILFTAWTSFGSQVLLYVSAMNEINPQVIEAAKLDGCGPVRELVSIIFPSILPTISTFLISGIATFFTSQGNLYTFFYGNWDGMTPIGYELYNLVNQQYGSQEFFPLASALGILCTLVAVPLTMGFKKLLDWKMAN